MNGRFRKRKFANAEIFSSGKSEIKVKEKEKRAAECLVLLLFFAVEYAISYTDFRFSVCMRFRYHVLFLNRKLWNFNGSPSVRKLRREVPSSCAQPEVRPHRRRCFPRNGCQLPVPADRTARRAQGRSYTS